MPSLAAAVLKEQSSMDLHIPPEFERAILDRVAAGRYASTEDALKDCFGAIWPFEAAAGEDVDKEYSATMADLSGVDLHQTLRVGQLDVPPTFEVALRRRLGSGRYRSCQDVFNAFVTALEQQEEYEDKNFDWLRREIQIGIDQVERGQVVDGETAFARLRERLARRAKP